MVHNNTTLIKSFTLKSIRGQSDCGMEFKSGTEKGLRLIFKLHEKKCKQCKNKNIHTNSETTITYKKI